MIFFDTETCGFHGPTVLIQWAEDDGPINLHSVWTEPIKYTIELIEMLVKEGVCGFNLAFDWFHICQTYTTLIQFPDWRVEPIDHKDQYAIYEKKGRDGSCLKPAHALDLMLHARKGPYQSTMNRKDIKIKKVPTALAWDLAKELDKRVPLKDIYFARQKDVKRRWQVTDIKDDFDDVIPEFKDIVLKFKPSSALKALAQDALGIEKPVLFGQVDPPDRAKPIEFGYAPYALAVGEPGKWNGAWPDSGKINIHVSHWAYNSMAREYASDDVDYTRRLYDYFGKPPVDDDDSILACMVAAVRWRGYAIDVEALKKLRTEAQIIMDTMEHNFLAPAVCRKYLEEVLDDTQRMVMKVEGKITTKAVVLEEIIKWTQDEVCKDCKGNGCKKCDEGLIHTEKPLEVAIRAQKILDIRHAQKEISDYNKLILAGRLHADFKVIGTKSTRMSGAGGLSAHGIRRAERVRRCFTLAFGGLVLCGGDFEGFEVVLMDAAYGDPVLREKLMSGKSIHGLFGEYLFPGMTYDKICASKGASDPWKDYYTRSKNGVFAVAYGGEGYTLTNRVGIPEDVANEAFHKWCQDHKVWGENRLKIANMFCSMRQEGGIGTKVIWSDPADYIESLFGFRRYFTLENTICKSLFNLAEDPPKEWIAAFKNLKVRRRDRDQTAVGALRSALFAAAFALQAANMRAAGNHVIQASGGQLTKFLQCRIWGLQPSGINAWRVSPMNVHDEIMCPTHPSLLDDIVKIKDDFLEEYRDRVPLIAMDWGNKLTSWADK